MACQAGSLDPSAGSAPLRFWLYHVPSDNRHNAPGDFYGDRVLLMDEAAVRRVDPGPRIINSPLLVGECKMNSSLPRDA